MFQAASILAATSQPRRRATLQQLCGRTGVGGRADAFVVQNPFKRRLAWIVAHHPPRIVRMLERAYVSLHDLEGDLAQSLVLDWLARTFARDDWPESWDDVDRVALALSSYHDHLANRDEGADGEDDPEALARLAWDDATEDAERSLEEDRHTREQADEPWYRKPPRTRAWMEIEEDGPRFFAEVPNTNATISAQIAYGEDLHGRLGNPPLYVDGIEDPDDELPLSVARELDGVRCSTICDTFIEGRRPFPPDLVEALRTESGDSGESYFEDALEAVRCLLYTWKNLWESIPLFFLRQHLDDDRRAHPQISIEGLSLDEALSDAAQRMVEAVAVQRRRAPVDDALADDQERTLVRWPDGDRVVEILWTEALRREGQRMTHCIGDERTEHPRWLREGQTRVLSYRTAEDVPKGTAELDAESGEALDFQGPHDGPIVSPRHCARLGAVLDRIRRDGIQHRGSVFLRRIQIVPELALLDELCGDMRIMVKLPLNPVDRKLLIDHTWAEAKVVDEALIGRFGWTRPRAVRIAWTHVNDPRVKKFIEDHPGASDEEILGEFSRDFVWEVPSWSQEAAYEAMLETVRWAAGEATR